jgi:hypothetical protein
MHVLLYEQDAAATLVCVLPNDRQQALDDQRCQAEAQFINEQEFGPPGKGPGHRKHLLLSPGKQTGGAVLEGREAWEVAVGSVDVGPLSAGPQPQVFCDSEAEEISPPLRDV